MDDIYSDSYGAAAGADAPAEVATGTGAAFGAGVSIPGVASAGVASGVGVAPAPSTSVPLFQRGFNALVWPKLVVNANFGGGMVDIGTDSTGRRCILGFNRSLGRSSPIDSADPGAATLVFNNRSGDYDAVMAGADFPLTVGTPIEVQAEWPVGTRRVRFTGTVTEVLLDVDTGPLPTVTVTCEDGLAQLGRAQFAAGVSVLTSATTGERVDALATQAGWTAARSIDAGQIPLWNTMELGTTALDLMQRIEMTEAGLLFVAENGTLTFWDRYHHQSATRSTVNQLTMTDSGAAGTVKVENLTRTRSRDQVYNDIRLTRDADPAQDPALTETEPPDEPVEQVATDATSVAANGLLNLPGDVGKLHCSDPAVLDHASMLLAQHKDVRDLVGTLTINLLHPKVAAENLYAAILALTLLDRVVVFRDYGPASISFTLHIQRIEEDVAADPPTWTLTLTTSNVPPVLPRFILGTSTLGSQIGA